MDCLYFIALLFFFFKQNTSYVMRMSYWSSDVCSSDLRRSGGDDDVLRAHGLVRHVNGVVGRELRIALQPVDLVLLEQELDAAGQALDRVLALAVHGVEVELGLHLDPHLLHRPAGRGFIDRKSTRLNSSH